jgi:hypothetical protein
VNHCNNHVSQTAKDVRASLDTFIDVFERIGTCSRRLETFVKVKVPLTVAMVDIIICIKVEILSILAITTKEIKCGQISE